MFLSYFNILRFTREAKRRVDQHKDSVIRQQEMQTRQESESYFFERNKRRFRMTQEEAKITNTLLIVVACFMACWAPFATTMFFDVYYAHSLPRILDISTLLLGYANSMCNPIVYGVRNQAVRSELVRLVTHCHCPRFNTSRVSVLNTFQASSVMACQVTAAQAPDMLQVSRLLIAESASDETNTLHSTKPALRSTDNTQIDQDTTNLSSSDRFIRHQRSV